MGRERDEGDAERLGLRRRPFRRRDGDDVRQLLASKLLPQALDWKVWAECGSMGEEEQGGNGRSGHIDTLDNHTQGTGTTMMSKLASSLFLCSLSLSFSLPLFAVVTTAVATHAKLAAQHQT